MRRVCGCLLFSVMLWLMTLPVGEVWAQEDVFDGTYFSFKIGWDLSLRGTQRLKDISRSHEDGFAAHVAMGARLDFGLPLWMRSELELGFQRYDIKTVIRSTGNMDRALDRSQMISIVWHNYLQPLSIHSKHQIWLGLGVGGAFAQRQLTYVTTENMTTEKTQTVGSNFLALASLGYDYRILERSRFSDDYLSLGVLSRFLFADGFQRETTTQVMVILTYGF